MNLKLPRPKELRGLNAPAASSSIENKIEEKFRPKLAGLGSGRRKFDRAIKIRKKFY